jgi:hypothetical protein
MRWLASEPGVSASMIKRGTCVLRGGGIIGLS